MIVDESKCTLTPETLRDTYRSQVYVKRVLTLEFRGDPGFLWINTGIIEPLSRSHSDRRSVTENNNLLT